eukprot:TRINITY_DN5828_c0_g1_i1.p1 TRINITY_DN5828_c0_g1~~TRINITY_DN5828_c0_g1_i1.p1  ORF type:complete len:505 (-),score=97.13 TRINITY_DN5828_c0_g1_i1:409-1923(-)
MNRFSGAARCSHRFYQAFCQRSFSSIRSLNQASVPKLWNGRASACRFPSIPLHGTPFSTVRLTNVEEMLAELERHEERERKEREEKGIKEEDVKKEDEDYLGLGKIPDKFNKELPENTKDDEYDDIWEDFDEDADHLEPWHVVEKRAQQEKEEFNKKFKAYQDLFRSFQKAKTFDEAYQWIDRIEKFEEKNFQKPPEYRVIGWLMNKLKGATGKERFLLLMKTQRALKQVKLKETFDPRDPQNYKVIERELSELRDNVGEDAKEDDEKAGTRANDGPDVEHSDEEEEEKLHEKLTYIDREIKKRLASMEVSAGKQLKELEEEVRDLVEQRESLTSKIDVWLSREGFEARFIYARRTCKVTKGGQVHRFSAIVACGNYNGVVGWAKEKGKTIPVATKRAYAKTFKNLQYVERYHEHTIPHAIEAKFKRTKVYLWPGAMYSGMRANKYIKPILQLAGYKNVKAKVIGSRNPYNTVKALFIALNSIETPKDIQDKFGRTVVEPYLLK